MNGFKPVWLRWEVIFDVSDKESRLQELEQETSVDGFWDNNEKAQELLKERSSLNREIEEIGKLNQAAQDLLALLLPLAQYPARLPLVRRRGRSW